MKLTNILVSLALAASITNAGEFVDYKKLTKVLKSQHKKTGLLLM